MTDTQTTEETDAPPARKGGAVVLILCCLMAAAAGAATPHLLTTFQEDSSDPAAATEEAHGLSSTSVFVPFGDVTVNLDEGRLSRYLRLKITLQVKGSYKEELTKLVEQRQAVLRNWLLSHLSDKDMDSVRGAGGQNRLRREIQDQFNTILFPDGYDRIQDVLFEEFAIQ